MQCTITCDMKTDFVFIFLKNAFNLSWIFFFFEIIIVFSRSFPGRINCCWRFLDILDGCLRYLGLTFFAWSVSFNSFRAVATWKVVLKTLFWWLFMLLRQLMSLLKLSVHFRKLSWSFLYLQQLHSWLGFFSQFITFNIHSLFYKNQ